MRSKKHCGVVSLRWSTANLGEMVAWRSGEASKRVSVRGGGGRSSTFLVVQERKPIRSQKGLGQSWGNIKRSYGQKATHESDNENDFHEKSLTTEGRIPYHHISTSIMGRDSGISLNDKEKIKSIEDEKTHRASDIGDTE